MDYSKVVLLPEEMALIKKLKKQPSQKLNPKDETFATAIAIKWQFIVIERDGGYSLSKEGLRFLAFTRYHRRELWLKNIWIPILVSIATHIALHGLEWLWPRILQLLSNTP